MGKLIRSSVAAGFVLFLCLASGVAMAQEEGQRGQRGLRGGPGGQFDPQQMRERMMESMREQLGATDEAEWNVIQPLLSSVVEKRFETQRNRMRMGAGMFARGGRGGGPAGPGGPGGPRGGFFGEPSAEQTALGNLLESPNAKSSDIKSALKNLRDARKKQEAELEKACEDLKKVLSVKQEAQLVLMGVLD
ncbi:hypothetical protein HS125_04775 [bacterium]|nr:hypothetical protein [bacterium]